MEKEMAESFEMFKGECDSWQWRLGLHSWNVRYECSTLDKEVRAEVAYDIVNCCATITLNDLEALDQDELSRTALHEMCELLLCRMAGMASQRFGVIEADIEEETHRIIRTLEKVLEDDWGEPVNVSDLFPEV